MKHHILQSRGVARIDNARQGLSEDVLWLDVQLTAEALAKKPPRGRQEMGGVRNGGESRWQGSQQCNEKSSVERGAVSESSMTHVAVFCPSIDSSTYEKSVRILINCRCVHM